jgi:glycosyltransferase involved in cell wall biosynthesis
LTCRYAGEAIDPGDTIEAGSDPRVERLAYSNIRYWGTIRYLADLKRRLRRDHRRYDVVYVSMLKHAAYGALRAFAGVARRSRPTIVLRAEGAGATGDAVWQDRAPFGGWIRATCRTADSIVTPTSVIERELSSRGYPADRLTTLSNGVTIPTRAWVKRDVSPYRRKLGLPDRPTVVFTGRLSEEKNLSTLIAAARRSADGAEFQILLVGDGPLRSTLVGETADLLRRGTIRFVGQVDDVEPFLRASDLFVLPSRFEGMSLALLEAAALGLPIAASSIEPNRRLIESLGGTSRDVALIDADDVAGWANQIVATIVDDREEELGRSEQGVEPRHRTAARERFGIDSTAEAHLKLFRSLLAEGRAASEH